MGFRFRQRNKGAPTSHTPTPLSSAQPSLLRPGRSVFFSLPPGLAIKATSVYLHIQIQTACSNPIQAGARMGLRSPAPPLPHAQPLGQNPGGRGPGLRGQSGERAVRKGGLPGLAEPHLRLSSTTGKPSHPKGLRNCSSPTVWWPAYPWHRQVATSRPGRRVLLGSTERRKAWTVLWGRGRVARFLPWKGGSSACSSEAFGVGSRPGGDRPEPETALLFHCAASEDNGHSPQRAIVSKLEMGWGFPEGLDGSQARL